MLSLLSERETGILSPLILRRAQTARRYFSLDLSKDMEIQEAHKGSVNSLDLDVAENRYLLSGASDSTITIHDTQSSVVCSGQQTYPQVCKVSSSGQGSQTHSVETVQWYPVDTGLFTSSGADHQLKVWDTNNLKVADSFTFSGIVHNHHMSPVARKHTLVAVGVGQSTVKLVDIRSGSASHQLKGHDAPVYSVRWSSRHEFLLASGGVDRKVILWDVRKAKGALLKLDQHSGRHKSDSKTAVRTAHSGTINSLHFTPDGLHLVTFGTDDRVKVWETSGGDLLKVNFGPLSNTVKKALQMEVVADSSHPLLFVPSEHVICVFDLFRGEQLARLNGHYNYVNCCVAHPETQYLFSGGTDRNLLVWTPVSDCEKDSGDSPAREEGEGRRRSAASVTADAWSTDEDE